MIRLGSISSVGDDTYVVGVQESFNIYYENEENEVVESFHDTYNVKEFEYDVY